jgi:hypothetical protein
MLRTILIFGLFVFSFTFSFAQNGESNEKVIFKADTEFSAQSETEIDSEKAKIGGDVYFVITEEVKGEGTDIAKGSELYARVVNVQKASAENKNTSKITILFDFVKKDGDFVPLTAGITSVEGSQQDIKFEQSPTFAGGTILSIKAKNLHLDKGKVFRIKLLKDITSK